MDEPTPTPDSEVSNKAAEAGAAVLRFHMVYERKIDLQEGVLEQIAREVFVAMRDVLEAQDGAP